MGYRDTYKIAVWVGKKGDFPWDLRVILFSDKHREHDNVAESLEMMISPILELYLHAFERF